MSWTRWNLSMDLRWKKRPNQTLDLTDWVKNVMDSLQLKPLSHVSPIRNVRGGASEPAVRSGSSLARGGQRHYLSRSLSLFAPAQAVGLWRHHALARSQHYRRHRAKRD